jgi:hypothetical protein
MLVLFGCVLVAFYWCSGGVLLVVFWCVLMVFWCVWWCSGDGLVRSGDVLMVFGCFLVFSCVLEVFWCVLVGFETVFLLCGVMLVMVGGRGGVW